MAKKAKKLTLRKFNNSLSVVAVLLGLYIMLSPFIPLLFYWLRDTSPAVVAPYQGQLAEANDNSDPDPIPDDNRIVIPSLSLNEPVKESTDIGVINNGGTWRRPQTSSPDQGGNTVIVGHRYFASKASTFYNLDKVAIGERIAVYWEKKEYLYEVESVRVVEATAIEIENQTSEPKLTLYTCHPLWTAKNRLVVTAVLVMEDEV